MGLDLATIVSAAATEGTRIAVRLQSHTVRSSQLRRSPGEKMSRRNRREFLEDSMLAAAAAVSTGPAGNLLAGQAPGPASQQERLGVAIVGVRGRGASHIGALAGRRGIEVLYVSDVDAKVGQRRAKEVEKRQGRRPQFVADMRRALDDPRVDVVTIATPNHLHALHAIWSLRAGKDVYLEKPASHNILEGQQLVEEAQRSGRICQVGMQCRSNPGMMAAIRYVQTGSLGLVSSARGLCYKRRTAQRGAVVEQPPPHVDYDLWLGPAPLAAVDRQRFHHDWHWQWEYGNGELGNQGVHQLDIARWGLGQDGLCQRVLSYGGRFDADDNGQTANTQVVLYDFENSTLVFEVRGLPTPAYRKAKVGVIFEGTSGYLVMHGYDRGAAFDDEGNKVREFRGGGDHFGNFLRAVRARDSRVLTASIEEGHISSALCHLGNISYRLGAKSTIAGLRRRVSEFDDSVDHQETLNRMLTHLRKNKVDLRSNRLWAGKTLCWDAEAECFAGDAQANALLTRSYRSPYTVFPASDA